MSSHRRPLYDELAEYFGITLTHAQRMSGGAVLRVIRQALDDKKLTIEQVYPDEAERMQFLEGQISTEQFIRRVVDDYQVSVAKQLGTVADERLEAARNELEAEFAELKKENDKFIDEKALEKMVHLHAGNERLRRQRDWLGLGLATTTIVGGLAVSFGLSGKPKVPEKNDATPANTAKTDIPLIPPKNTTEPNKDHLKRLLGDPLHYYIMKPGKFGEVLILHATPSGGDRVILEWELRFENKVSTKEVIINLPLNISSSQMVDNDSRRGIDIFTGEIKKIFSKGKYVDGTIEITNDLSLNKIVSDSIERIRSDFSWVIEGKNNFPEGLHSLYEKAGINLNDAIKPEIDKRYRAYRHIEELKTLNTHTFGWYNHLEIRSFDELTDNKYHLKEKWFSFIISLVLEDTAAAEKTLQTIRKDVENYEKTIGYEPSFGILENRLTVKGLDSLIEDLKLHKELDTITPKNKNHHILQFPGLDKPSPRR